MFEAVTDPFTSEALQNGNLITCAINANFALQYFNLIIKAVSQNLNLLDQSRKGALTQIKTNKATIRQLQSQMKVVLGVYVKNDPNGGYYELEKQAKRLEWENKMLDEFLSMLKNDGSVRCNSFESEEM